jgi:hypothetical protein
MKQDDKVWWDEARADGRGWFVFREGILRQGTKPAGLIALLAFVSGAGVGDSIRVFVVFSAFIGAS